MRAAAAMPGPFYVRLYRPATPVLHADGYDFELGKGDVMRQGEDVSIVGTGVMVATALEAAEALAQRGVSCRVINIHTLCPLDEEVLVAAARETGGVVTVEEHLSQGGLGSRGGAGVGVGRRRHRWRLWRWRGTRSRETRRC